MYEVLVAEIGGEREREKERSQSRGWQWGERRRLVWKISTSYKSAVARTEKRWEKGVAEVTEATVVARQRERWKWMSGDVEEERRERKRKKGGSGRGE